MCLKAYLSEASFSQSSELIEVFVTDGLLLILFPLEEFIKEWAGLVICEGFAF